MVYYGSKTAKNTNPSSLWNTYFTSSKHVADLISRDGKQSFDFEIRRTFTTRAQAHRWETKVLRRMKVRHDTRWINRNDCLCAPSDLSGKLNPFYGKKHSDETKMVWSRQRKGKKNPSAVVYQTGRKQSESTINKRATSNSKSYTFIDPQGCHINITNLHQYCKDNNLDSSNMVKVFKGKHRQHKGYTASSGML